MLQKKGGWLFSGQDSPDYSLNLLNLDKEEIMKHLLLKTAVVALVGMVLAVGQALAAKKITVTVKNLTNGLYFTPLLITAHDGDTHLFEVGEPASYALQAMPKVVIFPCCPKWLGAQTGTLLKIRPVVCWVLERWSWMFI